jgi:FlaA1/EpsC-like NDP-sugar epimerase
MWWKGIELKVKKKLKKGTPIYIWGAGIHTSQLFAFTDLNKYLSVKGLLDSSTTKWGKQFGDLKCYSPDTVDLKAGDIIIISSFASEEEIYQNLEKYRRKGVIVLRLYGGKIE